MDLEFFSRTATAHTDNAAGNDLPSAYDRCGESWKRMPVPNAIQDSHEPIRTSYVRQRKLLP
jgi:hypothetical protein